MVRSPFGEMLSRRGEVAGDAGTACGEDARVRHRAEDSTDDARMAYRMLEYLVSIERSFRMVPRQLVLYVGEAPMRMESRIGTDGLSFECGFQTVWERAGRGP